MMNEILSWALWYIVKNSTRALFVFFALVGLFDIEQTFKNYMLCFILVSQFSDQYDDKGPK